MESDAAFLAVSVGLLAFILTFTLMKFQRVKGLLAEDVHKEGRPLVPRMGGISLLIVFLISSAVTYLLGYTLASIHFLTVAVAGIIGLVDDVVDINAKLKIVVFMVPALIPIILGAYVPRPYIPLVGSLRITIIYPLILLAGYTVSANALNMADTHNGTAPSATLIILISLVASALAFKNPQPMEGALIFSIISLAALIAYLPFNIYPAKLFNGNVGSFLMGALLMSASVMLRREYLFLLLLTPLILNSFAIITSIGGVINRFRISKRPVYLGNDLRIYPDLSRDSPVTLVQFLTLSAPLTEKELVTRYILLLIVNSGIVFLLYFLMSSFSP